MRFHIVRNNETLEEIMFLYSLEKKEIIEENKHIRVWNRLVPGTKLKIPSIPEEVGNEVDEMEPFIEDYYPKKDYSKNYYEETTNIEKEVEIEKDEPKIVEETTINKDDLPEELKRLKRLEKEFEEEYEYPYYTYYYPNYRR